ncbi:hypothetical protein BDFB_015074 [Asbolus verrucosus]|jgi:hypothetical protein
MMKKK